MVEKRGGEITSDDPTNYGKASAMDEVCNVHRCDLCCSNVLRWHVCRVNFVRKSFF